MGSVKHGNQYPTQFVYLDSKKSDSYGKRCIALYEKSGRKAQKWQKELIHHILSCDKNGFFIHPEFGYSVPRRNGKNEIICMIELFGLSQGWHIMHTAHLTNTSTGAFDRLYALVHACGFVEGGRGKQTKEEAAENPPDFTSSKSPGREKIAFIDYSGGGLVNFRTRTAKGGLGEGYDLLIIDEAQEFTDDQDSAIKPVVTDSLNPLKIFTGTPPTAYSSGTVFMRMRNEVLSGKRQLTGWAEWSVDHMTDVHDKSAWYIANPAMGYHIDERKILVEAGHGDDIDFNIQRLGLWLQYNQKSAISEVQWDELKVDAKPKFTGRLYAGIKYGKDGTNVALSIAVKTDSDKIFVETVDCRNARVGDAWILDFLTKADVDRVAVDGASGQAILKDEMYELGLDRPTFPTVKEFIKANSLFTQALDAKLICHSGQPSLKASATNCDKRPIGTNGGFGYKSLRDDVDIALLDSVILAHWLCVEHKDEVEQTISY